MSRVLALLLFALIATPALVQADIVYQANGAENNYVPFGDDGTPNRPAGDHLANTITLGGTARNLDSAVIQLYQNIQNANLTFTLALYAGADPNTGALLTTTTAGAPRFTNKVTFNFGGLLIPDTLTFVVSAASESDSNAGVISSHTPPDVGSGPNSLWYGTTPGTFVQNSTWAIDDGAGTNYLFATFNASTTSPVPEPVSLMLLGTGLVSLMGHGYRRMRGTRFAMQ